MKISKEVWVIMDKGHRVIGCGIPRNRRLSFIENAFDQRVLTYTTEGRAKAGFKGSQFFLDETDDYMTATYGTECPWRPGSQWIDQDGRAEEIYEAVKVRITMEVAR